MIVSNKASGKPQALATASPSSEGWCLCAQARSKPQKSPLVFPRRKSSWGRGHERPNVTTVRGEQHLSQILLNTFSYLWEPMRPQAATALRVPSREKWPPQRMYSLLWEGRGCQDQPEALVSKAAHHPGSDVSPTATGEPSFCPS